MENSNQTMEQAARVGYFIEEKKTNWQVMIHIQRKVKSCLVRRRFEWRLFCVVHVATCLQVILDAYQM